MINKHYGNNLIKKIMERESILSKEGKNKFNISCKISNHQSCQDRLIPFFGYIEYKIILKTNLKVWEIKRRYKHFDELHKKLSKKIKNMPKLPHKTIFKSKEIIDDRKIKLQKYLTNLLKRDDVYNYDSIFDFIELNKEEFLFMKDNIDEESSPETSPLSSFKKSSLICPFRSILEIKTNKENTIINDNFFYSQLNSKDQILNNKSNANKKFINEFLDDLNLKKKDMSLIIKNFKEKMFDQNKNVDLQSEDIYKLFFGDKTSKKLGLLFHCGDIKGNPLGAELCIGLLGNLLIFEYNLKSELFIEILRIGKIDNFHQMKLIYHLKSGKQNLYISCCIIIKAITNNDKGIKIDNLLGKDKDLINKVDNFLNDSRY